MDSEGLDMLEVVESLSTEKAAQIFKGERVEKYFEACPETGFAGGKFGGVIDDVVGEALDEETGEEYTGLLFHIQYDDDDLEHVTAFELCKILKNKARVEKKLAMLQSANQQPAASGRAAKRARTVPAPADGPENGAAALGNANSMRPPPSVPAAHGASVRGTKRRLSPDDAPPLACVSADNAAVGPEPRRARTSQPVASQVADASESKQPVPYDGRGMRSIGLPGHLKRVEVVDFMCHEHMVMDFSPHVTFVSGTNGSGKSATLQALQCCLGVKASKTGRAGSFKTFVRSGANQAIVRVTLWNKPYHLHDAFQHEVYGDEITVERKISLNGVSAWALKDARGRVVAHRRDDLDSLLSTLGLNASNPVTVMTQDTSRSFLAGTSNRADQEKFQLYMEATQLGAIAENLAISKGQLAAMDAQIATIKSKYEEMEKEDARLGKALEQLQSLDAWRQEAKELAGILAWKLVEQHEEAIAHYEAQLADDMPVAMSKADRNIEELERELQTLSEMIARDRKSMETFSARLDEAQAEVTAAKNAQKAAHRQAAALKRKETQFMEAIKEHQEKKEGLEVAVAEVATQANAETANITLQYTRDLEAANAKQSAVQALVAERKAAMQAAEAEDTAKREALSNAKSAQADAEKAVEDLERELKRTQEASKNSVAAFGGQAMVKLVSLMKTNANKFHMPPVGPIGQYLQLGDSQWARAIEAAIGKSLNTVLVHNQHDFKVMRGLIDAAKFASWDVPKIAVMRLDLPQHRIPENRMPSRNVPTVLRLLTCTDHAAAVLNFLVDGARIEKLALARSIEEARTIVRREGFNVNAAYCTDGSKVFVRGATETIEQPDRMRGSTARLGVSRKQQIAELQQAIARKKADVQRCREAVVSAFEAATVANEVSKTARLANNAALKQQREASKVVDELMSQVPAEVLATQAVTEGGSQEGDDVHNEIIAATQAVVDFGEQLAEVREQLKEVEREEGEQRVKHEAAQAALDRLGEENQELAASFEDGLEKEKQAQEKVDTAKHEREQLEANRAEAENVLRDQKDGLKKMLLDAPNLCAREEAKEWRAAMEAAMRGRNIPDEKIGKFFTQSMLMKKIKGTNKKIEDAEKDAGGTLDALEDAYEKAHKALLKEGEEMKNTLNIHAAMRASYRRRKAKLAEVDAAVETMVSQRFNMYMRKKGHMGRLKLDREEQKLTLLVRIGENTNQAVKDLKQLSGGERSFTTVAFTLALGAETDMPFRAMDEFDVFMDSINRRVAMENLLTFAREHKELQFVFLTPQDMAAVHAARERCTERGVEVPEDFVKIVAMRPARPGAAQA